MAHSFKDLYNWLQNEDEISRESKAKRLQHLAKEFGNANGWQGFYGGILTKDFFEEARWCYANGQFIACVVLCQCFLEQSLQSLLSAGAPNYSVNYKWLEKAGFFQLMEKAYEENIIARNEYKDFNLIRKMRIQYVHPKPVFSNKTFDRRVIEENKSHWDLYEKDAKQAINIVSKLIQRSPFRI